MPLINRRQVLQLGGVAALGLGLPELLKAGEAKTGRRAKSCIFIYQYGGLSQLDSWDPKPNSPAETRGPYKPIATKVPGFRIGELMPELAMRADRYAVIRTLTHGVPVHDVANKMLLAGKVQPAADDPAFGSILTKLKPTNADIPPYFWLQKFGGGAMPPEATYTTGGFLGPANAPFVIGTGHDDNLATPGYRVKAFDGDASVSRDRLAVRRDLLNKLDPTPDRFRARAFDLLTGPAARNAVDLEKESTETRDRYGRNPLGQNLLLARRLIESGVRLVGVVAWCGLKPGEKFMSVETWDMHGNAGVSIFDDGWNGLGFALPRCDKAVSMLLDDLEERGLLESTLVVLVGEFGRTPRISKGSGAIGRDHWPRCYSGMIAGAGIRGGAVYGTSDKQGAYVQDQPVTLEDFSATLFHALGVPAETRLSPDGFTRPVSTGSVIKELF
jgi:hypothetical protein